MWFLKVKELKELMHVFLFFSLYLKFENQKTYGKIVVFINSTNVILYLMISIFYKKEIGLNICMVLVS